ncbi:MAG: hypothetical protein LQ350_005992 [Teloschistes chrysophthalmus]|nr:MAG: hypothetical protein LQ350_005992 [Niorma chrysophthalma]
MPFAIWCTTCPKPTIIGQGVRFNAEKKKVGNYHSTPIFQFRMKHNVCGGAIEIQTDPKNTAYVVTDGAKRRDTGDEKVLDGDMIIRSAEEREQLQNDAFAALEGRVEEKRQTFTDKSRIEGLYREKGKAWDDPYAASKKLRKVFRVERKARQSDEERTEDLKEKMSLGMDLVAETEDDRRRAELVDFGVIDGEMAVVKAKSKPLFGRTSSTQSIGQMPVATKTHTGARGVRETLQSELGKNTRAAMDPFLTDNKPSTTPTSMIKRKTPADRVERGADALNSIDTTAIRVPRSTALVDYESD